jgi:electron-transferring-flavoprotein dehydrogenase
VARKLLEMTEREIIEADIVIVGAGPAGLATAIHFRRLLAGLRARDARVPDLSVVVLEKGPEVGAHLLSGAILDPQALEELLPTADRTTSAPGVRCRESLYEYLTERRSMRWPWVPPRMRNHGCVIVCLNRLSRWLLDEAESLGIEVATGFAAVGPLIEQGRVVGVRTSDKGRDRAGHPKPGFAAGADVRARLTVLAEGSRGNVTRATLSALELDRGRQTPVFALGLKELWEIPEGRIPAGVAVHTLGYPLDSRTYGGGFLYASSEREVSLGLVVGLDYPDPRLDPHALFQRFKTHPRVRRLLEGGRVLGSGARTLNEGGWYAVPQPFADGLLIVGEAAGFLDTLRLKGIHLALRSGMLAAETAAEALLAEDVSARRLAAYQERIAASPLRRELWRSRNFRQGFRHGRWVGLTHAVAQSLSGGRGLKDPLPPSRGAGELRRLERLAPLDGEGVGNRVAMAPGLAFDRATSVFHSGTSHAEDQPSHLVVRDALLCVTRCATEYGHPCERFCPAGVYEIARDAQGRPERLLVHATDCLHCKTCEIMDPYQIIEWTPPEDGGGPRYEGL